MPVADRGTDTATRSWLQVFPLVSLTVVLIGLGVSSGGFRTFFTSQGAGEFVSGLLLLAWAILPAIALAGLIARRRNANSSNARIVLIAGSSLFLVTTMWFVIDVLRSESSTASLGFLTLPLAQWAIILITVIALAVRRRA